MANELERMLVSIEADTQKLRKAMREADSAVEGYENKVNTALSKAESRFDTHGSALLKRAAAIGAAFVGVNNVVAQLGAGANISVMSEQIGITVEKYQQLRNAIVAVGGNSAALDSALKKLATEFAQLKAGTGELDEFLRKHLPTVREQMRAQTDVAGAIDVAIDAISRLGSQHEKALIAAKLFGDGNAELINIFSRGVIGVRAAAAEVEKFGGTLDKEAADRLRDAKITVDTLTTALSNNFVLALAEAIKHVKSLGTSLSDFLGLDTKDTTVVAESIRSVGVASTDATSRVAGFAAAARRMRNEWEATVTPALKLAKAPLPPFITELDFTVADKLAALERKRLEANGEAFAAIKANMDDELEEFRRLLVEKKITNDQFEASRVALNQIAAKSIGDAYAKEREEFTRTAESFGTALTSPIQSAFSQMVRGQKVEWREMLAEMAANVATTFANKSLFEPLAAGLGGATATALGFGGNSTNSASSFLSNILPNLFRAGGGDVRAGTPVMVGERGPERFVPAVPGRVEPMGRSASGNTSSVTNHYTIDARGAEIGVEQRIMAGIAAAERQRVAAPAAVARERRRFPARTG